MCLSGWCLALVAQFPCRSSPRLRDQGWRCIRRTAIAASRCSSAPTGSAFFQAQHGHVGAIGGYDGGEGGVSDEPPSLPRGARELLQVRRFFRRNTVLYEQSEVTTVAKAVYQTNRPRSLALLVSSYRCGVFSGATRFCRSNRRLRRSRRRYIRRTAIAASRCSSAPTGSAVFQAQHGPVGAIGGYDGREGGVWDKPPSQPRVARQLLQVRRFSGATRFCMSNRRLRRSRRRCIRRTAIAASRCS